MTGFRKLCAKEDNVPPAPARWGTTPQPANGKTPTANELQGMATMFGLEVNDWAALSWLVVTCIAAYGDGTTPTPPDDGELPEEVATLIPWLLEEAAQAANAGHSTTADLLTLAAQLLGERVARAQSALLLEPVVGPAAPSDEEWEALKERLWDQYQTVGHQGERFVYDIHFDAALDDARDALARYGTTPTPIPVSERPILKRDPFNDDQGRCWCGTKACVDASGDIDVDIPPSWELREPCAQDDALLSANALPLPAAPGEEE
jgi:hypothetical protein